jgi:23S rRNA-/tRNA-specific pseudouridylate synthase
MGRKKSKGKKASSAAKEEGRATTPVACSNVIISIESLLQEGSDDCIRIVEPYLYTFTTHVKRRWIGQRLVDVYTDEFGGYSRSYYVAAIQSGKILVSNRRAAGDYTLKDGDILSHSVHLHEPAVLVSARTLGRHQVVQSVAETDELLVVDKPSTMAVHPCGSHQFNSLTKILEEQQKSEDSNSINKLYAIHRLDRVTSGLCLMAKSARVAQQWSKAMIMQPQPSLAMDHDSQQQPQQRVHKWYLARVRGKFPLNMNALTDNDEDTIPLLSNEEKASVDSGVHLSRPETNNGDSSAQDSPIDADARRTRNAFGYWTTHRSFQEVFECVQPMNNWFQLPEEQRNTNQRDNWLHLACPTRVAQHKDGVCQAGSFSNLRDDIYMKSVKASQTAFGVVSYSEETHSTLVVCKPSTGRSHQIRLHLQKLGHPIANDDNYGGDMWYGNDEGRQACQDALLELGGGEDEDLVQDREEFLSKIPREDEEGLEEYIAKTCIWCAGNGRDAKTTAKLKFRTQGRGIWLRAMKYQMSGGGPSFQAKSPTWAFL